MTGSVFFTLGIIGIFILIYHAKAGDFLFSTFVCSIIFVLCSIVFHYGSKELFPLNSFSTWDIWALWRIPRAFFIFTLGCVCNDERVGRRAINRIKDSLAKMVVKANKRVGNNPGFIARKRKYSE